MNQGELLALLLAKFATSMSNNNIDIKYSRAKKYDIDMYEVNGVWYPVLSDNYD